MQRLIIAIFTVHLLLLPVVVFAGELRRFESDATKQQTEPCDADDHSSRRSEGSAVTDVLVDSLITAFTSAAADSSPSQGDAVSTRPSEVDWKHRSGDRLLPRARLDLAAQRVEDQMKAVDLRGEVGYDALAGQVRYTRMWEDGSQDSLTATYLHFLLRIPLDKKVELDLGLGGLNLEGQENHAGVSATLPFQIHGKNLGVEFRPAWSLLNGNLLEDYDIAVVAGVPYVAFRLGYRWLLSENVSLSGPYAGVSLSW